MTTTYPSRILTVIDIDEPENVNGIFYYNYFTTDERTNDTGDAFYASAAERIDLKQLQRDIPRFVLVTWSPVPGSAVQFRKRGGQLLNNQTAEVINTEDTFSNFDFTSFAFQDAAIDKKLVEEIDNSTLFRDFINKNLTLRARSLNAESENIDGNILMSIFTDKELVDLRTSGGTSSTTKILSLAKDALINTQVNSKFVGVLTRASAYDPLNFYSNEMKVLIPSADALQDKVRQSKDAHLVSTSEFDSGFTPVVVTKLDGRDNHLAPTAYPVGYIVERSELSNNGDVVAISTFVLGTPNATSFYDTSIKYGILYRYTIKAVIAVSLSGFNDEQKQVFATGLVSSKLSKAIDIDCSDFTPPPPPADFKVKWNYTESHIELLWSLPTVSQRDIKYFQIFRRSSINEPFKLLRMYDFDDSAIITSNLENVSEKTVEKLITPKCFYLDTETTKDSAYIYALCCVDAHGLTSNYSHQFLVNFDRFKNKINVKTISRSGAPKSYPNLYLEEDTFVDLIKVSEPDHLEVYFDPEYLVITDNDDNDMKFMPLDDPNYKVLITFINIDNSISKTMTINFNDKRNQVESTKINGSKQKSKISISGLKIE